MIICHGDPVLATNSPPRRGELAEIVKPYSGPRPLAEQETTWT